MSKVDIAGALGQSFQIGRRGPVIFQDSVSPFVATLPSSPIIGDLFIQHGSSPSLWQYDLEWFRVGINFSFTQITEPTKIPAGQQMSVYGTIEVSNSVILEGEIVCLI